jgi:hypothetical protein
MRLAIAASKTKTAARGGRSSMVKAVQEGAGALTFIFVLRGMAAPFSHPLFTSMTGIGLGWSRQSNNGFVKIVTPVVGFMLAILLHATWNGTAIQTIRDGDRENQDVALAGFWWCRFSGAFGGFAGWNAFDGLGRHGGRRR